MAQIPPESQPELRMQWLRERWERRQSDEANNCREALIRLYGEERGKQIKYAEAFEICEYGRQISQQEIKDLFPFYDEVPPKIT